jgi:hypothetical protein
MIIIGFVCFFFIRVLALSALSPDLRYYFLKIHNDYRSNLALGNVQNKNGTNLPKASNIYTLRYSLRVESIARGSAEKCIMGSVLGLKVVFTYRL